MELGPFYLEDMLRKKILSVQAKGKTRFILGYDTVWSNRVEKRSDQTIHYPDGPEELRQRALNRKVFPIALNQNATAKQVAEALQLICLSH